MKEQDRAPAGRGGSMTRGGLIFLIVVVCLYAGGYVIDPGRTLLALSLSAASMREIAFPLLLVFSALLLTNRYLRPQTVARLAGARSGLRGATLALLAGIVSMGPAYAWYPLLGEIRRKGAGPGQVAVFLYGRAIKPFLLPVMAAYFGVVFTVVLNLSIAGGALLTGWMINHLFSDGGATARETPHGRVS